MKTLKLLTLAILVTLCFGWELTLSIHDINNEAANDYLILGTCEGCHDGFHYGEDGYDIPTGVTPYTDIQFFNLDWVGSIDDNNNQCESPEFAVDLRSIHPASDLLEWRVRGATIGHDSPLQLTWEMDELADEYEIYLYVGEEGYNLKTLDTINLEPDDLSPTYEWIDLNDDGIQQFEEWTSTDNIKILVGGCASIGMNTYYIDEDQDGWGSGFGTDYCPGFEPENYVDNNLDLNDFLYCLSNSFDDCSICDGINSDMDCAGECFGDAFLDDCQECSGGTSNHLQNSDMDCAGECFGDAFLDDCQECSGGTSNHLQNSDMDCAGECFGDAFLDDCQECNGENQSCLDEIFSYLPYNLYALIEENSILVSWNFDFDLEDTFIEGFNIYYGSDEESLYQIHATQNLYFETSEFNSGVFCISLFDQYNNETDLLCTIASEYHSFFYNLHEGANLLSFPYIPEDPSINYIFSQIEEQLDGIIGEGSAAYYNENINQWVGSLDEINYLDGYWIKVSTNLDNQIINFNVSGFPSQESNALYELHEGYNLISYIGEDNLLIEAAIPEQFSNYITSIIGEGVASVYSQTLNQWLGNLDELHYGSGYWIEATEPINFYWNSIETSNFIIKNKN